MRYGAQHSMETCLVDSQSATSSSASASGNAEPRKEPDNQEAPERTKAALLLALTLLIWAATAHAEGAWVLWKHSYEVW
jgi:hypothetical protein